MKLPETEKGKEREEAQERKEHWRRAEPVVAAEQFRERVMLVFNQPERS